MPYLQLSGGARIWRGQALPLRSFEAGLDFHERSSHTVMAGIPTAERHG